MLPISAIIVADQDLDNHLGPDDDLFKILFVERQEQNGKTPMENLAMLEPASADARSSLPENLRDIEWELWDTSSETLIDKEKPLRPKGLGKRCDAKIVGRVVH